MTAVAIAPAASARVHERSPMNRLPAHVSALALVPALTIKHSPADARRLIGDVRPVAAAILSHRITQSGAITFSLRSKSLAAGEPEIELTNWLEDELTMPGLVVADGQHNSVVPLLQRLIHRGQHYSLADLIATPQSRAEDISRPLQSFTPTPFETVSAHADIEIVGANPRPDEAMAETSLALEIDSAVRQEAIATWRGWLSQFAMSTGEKERCDHAAACLDAELRLQARPTADTFGRPFPTL